MSLGSVNKMIEHIDENQIKQYTRNLICAVEHCHKIANIIHKDINVNNLLINKDGLLNFATLELVQYLRMIMIYYLVKGLQLILLQKKNIMNNIEENPQTFI